MQSLGRLNNSGYRGYEGECPGPFVASGNLPLVASICHSNVGPEHFRNIQVQPRDSYLGYVRDLHISLHHSLPRCATGRQDAVQSCEMTFTSAITCTHWKKIITKELLGVQRSD